MSNRRMNGPTRRDTLGMLGIAGVAMLVGCEDESTSSGEAWSAGRTGGGGGVAGAGGGAATGSWATGGTAAMTGRYPDPFRAALGAACALTCATTAGPCYAKTIERKDISEGHDGLPMRLAFLLVDETCKPVKGATIDIWHTAPEGLYSGSDVSDFCTSGDAAARAARWFRGLQTSDANGRVDFDSCFPGWYSHRTIHIHIKVRINGTEYLTTQFVFDDALVDEIIATQPLYMDRGLRDTTNKTDLLFSSVSAADYTFQTERMADGAMLAWKVLVIRSSTATPLCSIGGGTEPTPGG